MTKETLPPAAGRRFRTASRRWLIRGLAAAVTLGCGGSADSAEQSREPFRLARTGDVAGLRNLLAEEPGLANVEDDGTSVLELVVDVRPAFPNMHETIEVLLEAGADPNYQAPEILRKAIRHGDPETLELLLEHGADPLAVDEKKGRNMLEYARSTGDERLVRIVDAWWQPHGQSEALQLSSSRS